MKKGNKIIKKNSQNKICENITTALQKGCQLRSTCKQQYHSNTKYELNAI